MFGFVLDMVDVRSQEQRDRLRDTSQDGIGRNTSEIFMCGCTGYISSFSATPPLTLHLKVVQVVHPSPSPPANLSIALYVALNTFVVFFSTYFS